VIGSATRDELWGSPEKTGEEIRHNFEGMTNVWEEAYQGGIQASYRWLEANQRLASLTLNYFMGLNRTFMDSFIKPVAQGDVRSHGQPGEQFRPK